jgi:hypothetical protein
MDYGRAIVEIQERNARVEADKRWETSRTRRSAVAFLIYACALCWLLVLGNEHPYRDALFPPIGYILSTTALGFLRVQYEARHTRKKDI